MELSFSTQVLDQLASSVEQVDLDIVMVLSKRAVDAGIDLADIVENSILMQASDSNASITGHNESSLADACVLRE